MILNFFDRDFNKYLILSLGGHLTFLVFMYIISYFTPSLFGDRDVEIIQSSVRVDVVGMPKFTVQELKKMQASPAVQSSSLKKKEMINTSADSEDIIKKDDLVIQKEGKPKKSFLNILSDYSQKKVVAKNQKPTIEESNLARRKSLEALDSLVIEGNRISKGTALVGDYTAEQNSEFAAYVENLPAIIRPFWKLPSYLIDQNLRCRIKIYLSKEGNLISLSIEESSGVSEFDGRAENAIRQAVFPAPSNTVWTRLAKSGIILGFPI